MKTRIKMLWLSEHARYDNMVYFSLEARKGSQTLWQCCGSKKSENVIPRYTRGTGGRVAEAIGLCLVVLGSKAFGKQIQIFNFGVIGHRAFIIST